MRAFALIELLVVIAIVAILAALLVAGPAHLALRTSAKLTESFRVATQLEVRAAAGGPQTTSQPFHVVAEGKVLDQAVVPAVEISVGSTTLAIPLPDGYSPITRDVQPFADVARRFVPPSNEQFAIFLANADATAAARGEIPTFERMFYVQTAKTLIEPFVSTAEFASMKRLIKAENADLVKKLQSEIPDSFQALNKGFSQDFGVELNMALDQIIPLPPHHETERSLAYSAFIKLTFSEDGTQSVLDGVVTMTVLHLKGKVLFLYGTAEKSAIEWCRSASQNWATATISANPSSEAVAVRERTPSQRGVNWDEIVLKTLAGAVLGGIAAIIGVVGSLIKRRKRMRTGIVQGRCEQCQGEIEFEAIYSGQTCACPLCNAETRLVATSESPIIPPQPSPIPPKLLSISSQMRPSTEPKSRAGSVLIAVLFGVFGTALLWGLIQSGPLGLALLFGGFTGFYVHHISESLMDKGDLTAGQRRCVTFFCALAMIWYVNHWYWHESPLAKTPNAPVDLYSPPESF